MNYILSEEEETAKVINEYLYSDLLIVHVPNEGQRSRVQGYKLKAQGMRKGFPDLAIYKRSGAYSGLFIEMKRKQNYRISDEQFECLYKLHCEGYATAICFGGEMAIGVINAYVKGDERIIKAAFNHWIKLFRERIERNKRGVE